MTLRRFPLFAAAALMAVSAVAATPAEAGVTKAVQTADSITVYLGVVPAALTRNHPGDRAGTVMHGGNPSRGIHNIHVMAALFDRASGARITDARVQARLLGERGRRWSVELKPMTVNGALTYGGYTSMEADMNATITVVVARPGRRRPSTARFDYIHD